MVKRAVVLLIIVLLSSANAHALEYRYIEIFNLSQEEVVRVVRSNPEIQQLITDYLESIDGIYGRIAPIPNDGYAVKIPLDPSVQINNKWLNADVDVDVDVVIVMFPDYGQPFLLVFENEHRFVCFTFKGNTNALWRSLRFSPIATKCVAEYCY